MLKTLFLAARLFLRELRAGEWLIIFFALMLSVVAVTSVHFYTERVLRGLEIESTKFLGGDIVITSSTPIARAWLQKAQELNLRTAEVLTFPSMISRGEQLTLVNIQAVSQNYPVLSLTPHRPAQRSVWVEPRLLSNTKDTSLTIGTKNFTITKQLTSDMDTLATGWAIAPRVLMRLEDVADTKILLPGSRVDYRLLIVGNKNHLQLFTNWLKPQLHPGQRILDIYTERFGLKNTVQRTQDYLQLVLLVCLVMSGVAIALSVQQYLRSHYSHVALWRSIGAKQTQITAIFFWQLIFVAIIAGLIGSLLGYVGQYFFESLFKQFMPFTLPRASFAPFVSGFISSTLLLFAFAYPIVSELPYTPPLHIWHKNIIGKPLYKNIFLFLAIIFLVLLMFWIFNVNLLTLFFLASLVLVMGFLYVTNILILRLIKIILPKTSGTLRRGLNELAQHPENTSLQLTGFTLIITFLLVLGLVKGSLLIEWQQSLPSTTPNYFAINIAPSDISAVKKFLQQHTVKVEGIYPMVRGRLVELNNQPILNAVPEGAQQNNALHRELNLSWMDSFPSDNKLVSGKMWSEQEHGQALVSVEQHLATDLGLKLGDELKFQIGDRQISAKIINNRSLEWSSFHPNFYMIFPPGLLDDFPTTYITSFHLNKNNVSLLNLFISQFPNITIIDMALILAQVQTLLTSIITAIQYLFMLVLGIGGLIFLTSLEASMDERKQTYSLLRVLGASRKFIMKSIVIEFSSLLILILILSFLLAKIITFLLVKNIFNF